MAIQFYVMTDEGGSYYGTQREFPTADDFRHALEMEGIVGAGMGAVPFNPDDLKPMYSRWCIGSGCGGEFGDGHFHVKDGPGRGHWKGWAYEANETEH